MLNRSVAEIVISYSTFANGLPCRCDPANLPDGLARGAHQPAGQPKLTRVRLIFHQHLAEPAREELAVIPVEQALQVVGADQPEVPVAHMPETAPATTRRSVAFRASTSGAEYRSTNSLACRSTIGARTIK